MTGLAAVLVSILSVPVFGQDTVAVDSATGYGINYSAALNDAQRKAIEQGCGVFIKSKSQTKDFELVMDHVYSESKGYIQSFKELSKRKNPDGTFEVTISAVVSKKLLESKVASYEMMMKKVGRPKIMMMIKTIRNNEVKKTLEIRMAVQRPFTDVHFRIIDPVTMGEKLAQEARVANMKDDMAGLIKVAQRAKADILIRGQALVQDEPGRKKYLYKCNINLAINVVRVSDASVMTSINNNFIGRKATLMDGPIQIFSRTCNTYVTALAKQARREMMAKWAFEQQNRIVVDLVIKTENYDAALAVYEYLSEQEWCSNCTEPEGEVDGEYEMTVDAKFSRAAQLYIAINKGFKAGKCRTRLKKPKISAKKIVAHIHTFKEDE